MQITSTNQKDSIVIHLEGRMDVNGANEIDLIFAGYCAAPHHKIVVDILR